jgi:hypothetical protein
MLKQPPPKVSTVTISDEYVRQKRAYLTDPNRKPLDSLPGEVELHTNSIRMNHNMSYKILLFFLGFIDRRFRRGDRNDIFFYLRLLTIKEWPPYSIVLKVICLSIAWGGLSGILKERLWFFGSQMYLKSDFMTSLIILALGVYGLFYIYTAKKERDADEENKIIDDVRRYGFWEVARRANGNYKF